ncbi:TIGR03067 domain-containing protein [Tautonia rosea]|uniref:TIGR03067 domain-containing protein n=1 Tax=Tautonia rosea TaxID=2728037 RepID=UPI00147327AC|nr:TIGR03067 domain-containing protein [Tautonia rosea]
MQSASCLLMTASLVLLGPAPLPADDLASLQGTWRAEAGPTGEVIITLTIEGDRFVRVVETSPRTSFTFRGRLRLDESAKPGTLDWVEIVGPGDEPRADMLGLYQLDGDAFIICSAAPGAARPDALAAGRGLYPSLQTYSRVVVSADEEPLTGDLIALQGNWSGNLGPNGALQASLSIEGRVTKFVIVGPDGQEVLASTGRVQLDESAKPKAMDWIPEGDGSQTLKSIYELNGSSLRVSLGLGRGTSTRPEAFSDDFRTFTLTKVIEDDQPDEIPD